MFAWLGWFEKRRPSLQQNLEQHHRRVQGLEAGNGRDTGRSIAG